MLPENKLQTLLGIIEESTHEELIWINGYLNGIVSKRAELASSLPQKFQGKVTVAYGTETGNSKKVATEFATRAKQKGIHVKVQSLDQYRMTDLSREEYFFTIISTHGEGDPPDAARKFYDHIHQNDLALKHIKYSVLALGDSSYPLFCKAGEDVDRQFQKAGATCVVPLQKCDVDYEFEKEEWFDKICRVLHNISPENGQVVASAAKPRKSSGKKTFNGKILSHINLNDRGSNKETYHIEIDAGSVLYTPGDSLGFIPENDQKIIEEIFSIIQIESSVNINYKDQLIPVEDILKKKLNIAYLSDRVVQKYAGIVGEEIPEGRIDLIDLLKIYPVKDVAHFLEVVNILEPIAPRLYSISSSPAAHPDEIHLTVAKSTFNMNGYQGTGLASGNLSRLGVDDRIQFYIHPNNRFRLPDESKDVIMIGPGTGIAPFRSFIAERDATGASGKNWLFFGDQHFVTDFLYQSEIQNWVETGVLTRVSTAFSRDQQEKVYVQHKILHHGHELFNWVRSGAHVYVCGAKDPMSIDVEKTLLRVIREFGDRTKEDAEKYLDTMKEEGRYVTDVY
jgi:sulfite reductase (NADPH) flavoprotein alpha-component